MYMIADVKNALPVAGVWVTPDCPADGVCHIAVSLLRLSSIIACFLSYHASRRRLEISSLCLA
jgi:hypothetical protein